MSLLSPRLQLKVAQKQILTPGLVQMVSLLQMNRLELKDMINQEVAENPVLEEAQLGEELTPQELQTLLEAERLGSPADEGFLQAADSAAADSVGTREAPEAREAGTDWRMAEGTGEFAPEVSGEVVASAAVAEAEVEPAQAADPFDEIDFGSFFDDYLDPGFKSPASENPEKPSFEMFLSAPETLPQHLESQLSLVLMGDELRDVAESVIGNLDENGYLTATLEEICQAGPHPMPLVEEALRVVQTLDPAGVGARDVRECLMLQLESRNGRGGVAWQIVSDNLKRVELKQFKDIAKDLGRPLEHVMTAMNVIRRLDPWPGRRYGAPGARQVEPDVYITKDGEDWIIQLNDDDLPQLRLNGQYRKMLDRGQEQDKEVRNYVKERFQSALLLLKNIEQRKQTIMKVCQSVVRRQGEFLDQGLDYLRPMMIKELAEEIGVHPSTVSRAVANKYAHTPQGVFELRYFFSEAVQGPAGSATPLLLVKRRVKKMIEDEDAKHPLTDDQITAMLRGEGIDVTRRTVAKYREDMKIPSTHQRRARD
jgi:RNA polymerase sigma-54 factor